MYISLNTNSISMQKKKKKKKSEYGAVTMKLNSSVDLLSTRFPTLRTLVLSTISTRQEIAGFYL